MRVKPQRRKLCAVPDRQARGNRRRRTRGHDLRRGSRQQDRRACRFGPAPVLPGNTPRRSRHRRDRVPEQLRPSLPPAIGSLSASVSGGSEVYRIEKDGFAERIWELLHRYRLRHSVRCGGQAHPRNRKQRRHLSRRFRPALYTTTECAAHSGHGFPARSKTASSTRSPGNVGNLYSIGPGSRQPARSKAKFSMRANSPTGERRTSPQMLHGGIDHSGNP